MRLTRPPTNFAASPGWLIRAGVCVWTALSLLAAPVARASEPAGLSVAASERFEAARRLFADDDYLPAADGFEALHRDFGDPLFLYYAGLAREQAGHDAQAIVHWKRALRDGLDDVFTEKARARLAQAHARTTAVTIFVAPAALADGATLELRYRGAGNRKPLTVSLADLPLHLESGDWTATLTVKHPGFQRTAVPFTIVKGTAESTQTIAPAPVEHPVRFELAPQEAVAAGIELTLRDPENLAPERHETIRSARFSASLRVGTWRFIAESPGRSPQTGSFDAGPGVPPVPLSFPSAAVSPGVPGEPLLPKKTRRRLALGLGLGGLVPATVGGVLTGLAARDEARLPGLGDLPEVPLDSIGNKFVGGSLLLGGAVGLWTGSALTAAPLRRRSWGALLGVSAAVSVGGLVYHLLVFTRAAEHFNDGPEEDMPSSPWDGLTRSQWQGDKTHLIASSLVFGFGTGLVLSAAANLIARKARRNSVALFGRPGLHLAF